LFDDFLESWSDCWSKRAFVSRELLSLLLRMFRVHVLLSCRSNSLLAVWWVEYSTISLYYAILTNVLHHLYIHDHAEPLIHLHADWPRFVSTMHWKLIPMCRSRKYNGMSSSTIGKYSIHNVQRKVLRSYVIYPWSMIVSQAARPAKDRHRNFVFSASFRIIGRV